MPLRSIKNEYTSPTKSEQQVSVKTIGFIINPVAGMGGTVGLKGTDGKSTLDMAIALGAEPTARVRAQSFLSAFETIKKRVRLVVGAGSMGEDEAQRFGFDCEVIGRRKKETTSEDTKETARRIRARGAKLLIFCGGDGTARDIHSVVKTGLAILGVPTGVKMHSAVFAVTPKAAAKVAIEFLQEMLPLREVEIMDVDEIAFREGRVSARLYGYMLTPYEPHLIQGNKMASLTVENEMQNQAAIAIYVIENMKPELIYIIGPGTTTRIIGDLLDVKKTVLGVDLFLDKKIIAYDVNEKQILQEIKGKPAHIIVTPIGGQGFIFGRGNQQISPKVICQVGLDNIIVLATERKLSKFKSLRVDTGDVFLDEAFRERTLMVITDYNVGRVIRVE